MNELIVIRFADKHSMKSSPVDTFPNDNIIMINL